MTSGGSKPPAKLPRTPDEALVLYRMLGLGPRSLALGKPARALSKKIPSDLRAFYGEHDRLGNRANNAPGTRSR